MNLIGRELDSGLEHRRRGSQLPAASPASSTIATKSLLANSVTCLLTDPEEEDFLMAAFQFHPCAGRDQSLQHPIQKNLRISHKQKRAAGVEGAAI